jgi:hypothetical protein
LRLSVDFPNRLSEIQIDRRKYLQIRPKSRYFFRSIWSRFGGRASREALLSTLDMAAASTPHQKRRLNHTATPRHPCSRSTTTASTRITPSPPRSSPICSYSPLYCALNTVAGCPQLDQQSAPPPLQRLPTMLHHQGLCYRSVIAHDCVAVVDLATRTIAKGLTESPTSVRLCRFTSGAPGELLLFAQFPSRILNNQLIQEAEQRGNHQKPINQTEKQSQQTKEMYDPQNWFD